MREPQAPFFDPVGAAVAGTRPLLAHPIERSAVERLVENILARASADADFLLITADAVQEIIREAPSDSDMDHLRSLVRRLRLRAQIEARMVPGKAEAAALLAVCPATAASLRMWRASMGHSCAAWGWMPLLDAMIAAADELDQQPRRLG